MIFFYSGLILLALNCFTHVTQDVTFSFRVHGIWNDTSELIQMNVHSIVIIVERAFQITQIIANINENAIQWPNIRKVSHIVIYFHNPSIQPMVMMHNIQSLYKKAQQYRPYKSSY